MRVKTKKNETTSIAALSRAPSDGVAPPILNALTVDVEDYYRVTGFENCVFRAE